MKQATTRDETRNAGEPCEQNYLRGKNQVHDCNTLVYRKSNDHNCYFLSFSRT